MLESPTLWITARFDGRLIALGAEAVRHIHDGETRAHVGRARSAPRPRLASWRTVELLTVEEGMDCSLVCRARQLPWWDGETRVLDADEKLVARLRGSALGLVRDGYRALVSAQADGGSVRAQADGAALAVWAAEGGGIRLRFLPATHEQPFLRMAALAVTLLMT